ncbi:30S ribosomal protein S18 [Patescibacteria group bacterium]|nr:30S ribosomal protein S18 [Patescibacteria group bacterium]
MPNYKDRKCQLCKEGIKYVDYKNLPLIRKYLSQYLKIVPKYYNGNCLKHQKMISKAAKNSRQMALIPYTPQ